MKSIIVALFFCIFPFLAHAAPQGVAATRQVLIFQQRLDRCLDTYKEVRSTADIAEYGQKVEDCYQKVGHEIIQTFYSKTPNMEENFDKLVQAINMAYFHMFAPDSCYLMCGTIASTGPYSYTTVAIRKYLDTLLESIQTRNAHKAAVKPSNV